LDEHLRITSVDASASAWPPNGVAFGQTIDGGRERSDRLAEVRGLTHAHDRKRFARLAEPGGGKTGGHLWRFVEKHGISRAFDQRRGNERREKCARTLVANGRRLQPLATLAQCLLSPKIERPDRLREHHRPLSRPQRRANDAGVVEQTLQACRRLK